MPCGKSIYICEYIGDELPFGIIVWPGDGKTPIIVGLIDAGVCQVPTPLASLISTLPEAWVPSTILIAPAVVPLLTSNFVAGEVVPTPTLPFSSISILVVLAVAKPKLDNVVVPSPLYVEKIFVLFKFQALFHRPPKPR